QWDIISQNDKLRPYIPETRRFTDISVAADILQKYRVIYLKPRWGQRFAGIIRIQQTTDGKYLYNFTQEYISDEGYPENDWVSKSGDFIAQSLEDVMQKTTKIRQTQGDYLVQQGINIAKYGDEDFEMRFLFQRGGDGKLINIGWEEGQKKYWETRFENRFGKRNVPILSTNLESLARAIALQIQSKYGTDFGQMTVQLALDTEGKAWLLETNPQPGITNQFDAYGLPKLSIRASNHLLGYGTQLSGYRENLMPLQRLGTTTLKDGQTAEITEEINPLVLYKFAQSALIADRTRYITIRDGNNQILGCIALIRPYSQWLRSTDNPNEWFDAKPRWEIGGVLVAPNMRGKGIARKLFETAIQQLKKSGANEAIVNVTGTFDINKAGIVRTDSIGIEKLVKRFPHSDYGNSVFGYGALSFGPTYLISF
ncbi:GNAT family N-acetyltransferase, partial [Candidatus Gottesmanbacteria bacterium]|nr:GNAT family N-acetyltransferase [Candidatus Gottesmanbacteria bacterium]